MSTLADPNAREALLVRLRALRPDSPRQWGKMNPHQMVCHLTDGFRMAAGEREPGAVDNILTRTVIRCTRRFHGRTASKPYVKPIRLPAGARLPPNGSAMPRSSCAASRNFTPCGRSHRILFLVH